MKSGEHRIRPARVRFEKGEHVNSDPDFNPADELFERIIAQVEEEGRADDARCKQNQRLDPSITPDLIEENEGGREKYDGAKMKADHQSECQDRVQRMHFSLERQPS